VEKLHWTGGFGPICSPQSFHFFFVPGPIPCVCEFSRVFLNLHVNLLLWFFLFCEGPANYSFRKRNSLFLQHIGSMFPPPLRELPPHPEPIQALSCKFGEAREVLIVILVVLLPLLFFLCISRWMGLFDSTLLPDCQEGMICLRL